MSEMDKLCALCPCLITCAHICHTPTNKYKDGINTKIRKNVNFEILANVPPFLGNDFFLDLTTLIENLVPLLI